MADLAYIRTSLWDDEWFSEIDNDAALIWLFLLTNSNRTLAGVYHLPIKKIIYYNPSLSKERVLEILAQFQVDKKIFYQHGWIVMRNHFKNQRLGGVKQWAAVGAAINACPDWLRERLLDEHDELFTDIDTLSQGYLYRKDTVSVGYRNRTDTQGTKRREEKYSKNTSYSLNIKKKRPSDALTGLEGQRAMDAGNGEPFEPEKGLYFTSKRAPEVNPKTGKPWADGLLAAVAPEVTKLTRALTEAEGEAVYAMRTRELAEMLEAEGYRDGRDGYFLRHPELEWRERV